MPEPFEDKLLGAIQSVGLLAGCGRVLLAVSGGADSVAMAHAMNRLRTAGPLECEFVIGHVNHCLRGDQSDADEVFVRKLAQQLGVPIICSTVDAGAYAKSERQSIETAARILRLQSLVQMAHKNGCQAIATAHHADDQAETVIHRLIRGTGFRGLCGIRPVSTVYGGRFIRPMLPVRRTEILQYCRDNNIEWRQDASNANLTFTRNRIRHRLLPELAGECALVDPLAKLALSAQHLQKRSAQTLAAAMDDVCLEADGSDRIVLSQKRLQSCPPWTFYEVVRRSLVTAGAGLRNYTQAHFDVIRQMAAQQKAKADFPGNIEIRVGDGKVVFSKTDAPDADRFPPQAICLPIGETVQFGPWTMTSRRLNRCEVDIDQFLETKDSCVEWFDAAKISGEIMIRRRQNGDRFRPIGGKGEKKVARFLIDAGLEAENKRNTVIIADAEKILWLAPIRMSEYAKIDINTTRMIEVKMQQKSLFPTVHSLFHAKRHGG